MEIQYLSPLSILVLAIFAVWGVAEFFVNPLSGLLRSMEGKTPTQFKEGVKCWSEKATVGEFVQKGLGCVIGSFASLLSDYVVVPLAVITAITRDMGNQTLAYLMGFIILLRWSSFTRSIIFSGKKTNELEVTNASDENLAPAEKLIKLPNLWAPKAVMYRLFFSLPRLYLWYLLAISLSFIN